MRKLTRRAAGGVSAAQGLAGVACLATGAYLLAGLGVALVVLGLFLLLGAWGSR